MLINVCSSTFFLTVAETDASRPAFLTIEVPQDQEIGKLYAV